MPVDHGLKNHRQLPKPELTQDGNQNEVSKFKKPAAVCQSLPRGEMAQILVGFQASLIYERDGRSPKNLILGLLYVFLYVSLNSS